MFGIGRAIQSATRTWRPWQRYGLAVVLIAAGAGLMWAGIGRGVVLLVAGVLILARGLARRRFARQRAGAEPPATPGS